MTEISDLSPNELRLQDSDIVYRLLRGAEGGVRDSHFELSSADRIAKQVTLSVWSIARTKPNEALSFIPSQSSSPTHYCELKVFEVRSMTISSLPLSNPLDVVWVPLVGDQRAGASGHAGISGLLKPPGMEKLLYKQLRWKLADLANLRLLLISKGMG